MSRQQTIKLRQSQIKQAFIEQLKHTPTIEQACQKSGTSRSSVCRWRRKSNRFDLEVEEALREGRAFISDIAETQLFSLIGEKKIEAIRLFLAHNNPRYSNKLELSGTVSPKNEPLTAELQSMIRQALLRSSLNQNEILKKELPKEQEK